MSGSAFAVTHHAFSSGAGRTSDGNGSHASTLKSPSYTKSVSWQHYLAVDIIAVSMDDFDRTLPNYDCCLLGPQIKYKFEEFNKKAAAVGKRVAVIDSMDYGMMRGDKILAAALALLDEPSLNK